MRGYGYCGTHSMWILSLKTSTSSLFIFMSIRCKLNIVFIVVDIYDLYTIQDRMLMWGDIEAILNILRGPTLMIGDFNAIFS